LKQALKSLDPYFDNSDANFGFTLDIIVVDLPPAPKGEEIKLVL
jgi:hypothetical protein